MSGGGQKIKREAMSWWWEVAKKRKKGEEQRTRDCNEERRCNMRGNEKEW